LETRFLKFWGICAAYAVLTTTLVHILLIFTPALGTSEGLLRGTDSVNIHRDSQRLLHFIKTENDAGYRDFPATYTEKFIAQVYFLIGSHPYPIKLMNSVLYASSAFLLSLLLFSLSMPLSTARLASLPFLLFPSAISWFSQLQFKDSLFSLGLFLFLIGWVRYLRTDESRQKKENALACGCIILSLAAIQFSRHYFRQILLPMGFVFYLYGIFSLFLRSSQRRNKVGFVLFGLFLAVMPSLLRTDFTSVEHPADFPKSIEGEANKPWEYSNWLPHSIDKRLSGVQILRRSYRYGSAGANTNYNEKVELNNASDIFKYSPYALVISLFLPYPFQFRGAAGLSAKIGQVLTSVEMAAAYILLIGLGLFFWRRRDGLSFLIALFAIANSFLLALIVTNIGTFYRLRFPYFQILLCLGLAGWLMRISGNSLRKRQTKIAMTQWCEMTLPGYEKHFLNLFRRKIFGLPLLSHRKHVKSQRPSLF
jgi:hypothetical protein